MHHVCHILKPSSLLTCRASLAPVIARQDRISRVNCPNNAPTAQFLPALAEIGRIALKIFIPGKDHPAGYDRVE